MMPVLPKLVSSPGPRLSTSATERPRLCRWSAVDTPTMPAPSTMTSALLGPFKFLSLRFAAPSAAGWAFPHYMTNLRLIRQTVSATRSAQEALALDAGLALSLSSAGKVAGYLFPRDAILARPASSGPVARLGVSLKGVPLSGVPFRGVALSGVPVRTWPCLAFPRAALPSQTVLWRGGHDPAL